MLNGYQALVETLTRITEIACPLTLSRLHDAFETSTDHRYKASNQKRTRRSVMMGQTRKEAVVLVADS